MLTCAACRSGKPTCSDGYGKKLPHSTRQGCRYAPSRGSSCACWPVSSARGARRAIEVGVFTGYSALSVALALPEDGELVACDVNEEWTAIARRYWSEAGVASKIRLHLAPALETLDALVRIGRGGQFDIAFIDADKTSYEVYYERCLELLRPGALVLVDNVLWSGQVADENDRSEDTVALRAFNARLRDDSRVELCMLPVGDGLTIARKLM